ncbi:hypothetical protein IKN40_08840 [bacterium]|nr:hypothetical protein [Clostridia bacterium]MBR4617961.1 hypothetical protein [Bacilli bacterium]MBR6908525.1 hypothetical protein [bacterium]
MSTNKIADKISMPSFTIDTIIDKDGNEIPGMKRMYDIALAANDSLMQWGAPGVGKSQAVQQWNNDKVLEYQRRIAAGEKVKPWNPDVCDVRLSMKEPVDLVGVPIPTKNEKGEMATVWAIPSMWPRDDGEFSGGVIHLDEMNQGQAAILNAAFQLIQDRALGEYKVPEGYLIIGSSNPAAFNNTVTEFSGPLSNRFSHFNVKANFESWMNHRLNHGGNLDVMTFLKTQGEGMLYDTVAIENRFGDKADCLYTDIIVTPRSWEVVERVLALPNGTKETGGFTIEEKQSYCTGRLGLGMTSRFFTWLKDKAKYQDWHDILVDGKDFKSESVDQFWAVQLACISAIVNTQDDELCRKYVLNFINASNHLKSNANKIINITQLIRLDRLKGNLKVFNPMKDAPELIKLGTLSLRS